MVPFEEQEITDASVSQDAASGTTTITFTRPLTPAGAKQPISAVPGDPTIILMAFGADNELAYHGEAPNRGGFITDLFCGDSVAGGNGTVAATPSPAGDAASAAPSAAPTAGGRGGGAVGEETLAPAAAAETAAPTLAGTAAPSAMTAAPTLAEGETMAPTIMMSQTPAGASTPSPAAAGAGGGGGDRGIGEDTQAPTAAGDSLLVTASPSSSLEDGEEGDGQDSDRGSRVAVCRWAAAAVAGIAAVLAALPM